MNQADLIWMNGEFVAWEDAKVHVLTHAMHYGTGVFEGSIVQVTPPSLDLATTIGCGALAGSSRLRQAM